MLQDDYYMLVGDSPEEIQKILQMDTPPEFQVEVPINYFPTKKTSLKELQYIIQAMEEEFKQNERFIIEADKSVYKMFLELLHELGVQKDHEQELLELDIKLAIPIMKLKYWYNRARPFQYALKAGIPFPMFPSVTAHTPSYPSGHTIQSYYMAAHLSRYYPQHREILMDLARDISYSRIQCGVHFPSDCMFGVTVFKFLWNRTTPAMRLARRYDEGI